MSRAVSYFGYTLFTGSIFSIALPWMALINYATSLTISDYADPHVQTLLFLLGTIAIVFLFLGLAEAFIGSILIGVHPGGAR